MSFVSTASGPMDTSRLGFTLMHEHIILQTVALKNNWPEAFDREGAIQVAVGKLREAKAAGVDTIVDATPFDLGRDVPLVAEAARRAEIQVIFATGTYFPVPKYFQTHSADEVAELFIRDITEGIQGTDIKAAIIKNASEGRSLAGPQETVFRAAARAHRRTGVPLTTHSNAPEQGGLDQQRVYAEEGVDLTRVIIGHSCDTEDLDYLKRLLDRGSYIGMDRFGLELLRGERLPTTEQRVRVITELCRQGYAGQIVLSTDTLSCSDYWSAEYMAREWPGRRYSYLPRVVLPALLEAGVSRTQIDQMTRLNPRAIFEREGAY